MRFFEPFRPIWVVQQWCGIFIWLEVKPYYRPPWPEQAKITHCSLVSSAAMKDENTCVNVKNSQHPAILLHFYSREKLGTMGSTKSGQCHVRATQFWRCTIAHSSQKFTTCKPTPCEPISRSNPGKYITNILITSPIDCSQNSITRKAPMAWTTVMTNELLEVYDYIRVYSTNHGNLKAINYKGIATELGICLQEHQVDANSCNKVESLRKKYKAKLLKKY